MPSARQTAHYAKPSRRSAFAARQKGDVCRAIIRVDLVSGLRGSPERLCTHQKRAKLVGNMGEKAQIGAFYVAHQINAFEGN